MKQVVLLFLGLYVLCASCTKPVSVLHLAVLGNPKKPSNIQVCYDGDVILKRTWKSNNYNIDMLLKQEVEKNHKAKIYCKIENCDTTFL